MEDSCALLAQKECVPCKGGIPPLQGDALNNLMYRLGHDWELVKGHHLEKRFAFPDFAEALAFTNKVGAIAEAEGHHPDIHLSWGRVRVVIWTHKIDGLTESDFVLAAKVEKASA
ncbi:MAG TPA: 4a-hydroxytetrahydrobiopterin dehydratase [Fibrobacteria bacterium]|nr:4a-hydroxytetrahydrobiopterin dehydratase [Fibrobacteria bacterium]